MKPVIPILLAAIAANAGTSKADTRCADLFAAMGRTYVADAEMLSPRADVGDRVIACPAGHVMQFAYDFAADRDAVPVTSAGQLVGTWVSDDIVGMVTGIFIPVYEILEIAPGDADGEVAIVQKVLRYGDPAKMIFSDDYLMPPVDVVAAGRIATYGEHVAVLGKPGELEPRRVRYHDIPVEGDRYTDLAMKMRMASFLQTRPINVRSDGTRLVFEMFDRLSPGGKRIMTFRRRDPASPARALKMIILAEISASHFHCLMQATETSSEGFLLALGKGTEEDFFAAVDQAFADGLEMEQIREKMLSKPPKAELEAAQARFLELADKTRALFEEGSLKSLIEHGSGSGPFGCPSLY